MMTLEWFVAICLAIWYTQPVDQPWVPSWQVAASISSRADEDAKFTAQWPLAWHHVESCRVRDVWRAVELVVRNRDTRYRMLRDGWRPEIGVLEEDWYDQLLECQEDEQAAINNLVELLGARAAYSGQFPWPLSLR